MNGLANDLEQYNLGAGHVGEVKHAYNLDGTSTNGNSKRALIHHSSTQSSLKVRKEKSGRDRIYALHQLVSPFGKTDMASVLFEATTQIKFFEGKIKVTCFLYFLLIIHFIVLKNLLLVSTFFNPKFTCWPHLAHRT
ncbi:transcription factor bHLH68-like [Bidens hawaiensis]|uniref:transcription factor bHLH68-like n=1 Tax=Bidens hawaiensis TaxID=980011 RepID=UPI004048FD81